MADRFVTSSLAALTIALVSVHDHAHACDISLPQGLTIIANPADTTTPSTPVVSVARVERGDDHAGCGPGSCDGNQLVTLQVRGTDDTTPTDQLGYLIEGNRPLPNVAGPRVASAAGQIMIFLATDDSGEDDLRLDLRVFTVDQAGNISTEPALVVVRDDGERCQT